MSQFYSYTPYIWPSILTVILLLSLSIYSWHHRSVPSAWPFATGSLLAAPWVAGSMLEDAAVDVASKIFWYKFESIWQLSAATAMTCFVLEFAWPGRWLTRRNLALLSIAPLLDVLLILTNQLHHLEWRSLTSDGYIIPVEGSLAWFFFAYAYGLGLLNVIVLAWLFLRSPQHRWPVAIMLTGQIAARTIFLLEALLFFQSDLPFNAIAIGFLFLMYAIVLFGFRIFDPIPLARQMAIEQLHAGMVVLDSRGRVTSLNPAAERILDTRASHAKNRHFRELLPAYPDGNPTAEGETDLEFSLGVGQGIRYYTLEITPLKDWRGLEVGRLLMLRDVTEEKRSQAQIIAQQRVLAMLRERERLARELHDNLGQVLAFVNTQGQAVRRLLGRGDIAAADEYVGRLVDVAREADVDIRESILGLRVTLSEQGFIQTLTQYLARYEKNYGIHTVLVGPETFADGMLEPLVEVQLLRILQEALTNVRKHASAHCVQIAFAPKDGCVSVTIQDDGQGFNPAALHDGSGAHIGLRVMRERAEEVGGSLNLHSKPGQGTGVVVRVPVRGYSEARRQVDRLKWRP